MRGYFPFFKKWGRDRTAYFKTHFQQIKSSKDSHLLSINTHWILTFMGLKSYLVHHIIKIKINIFHIFTLNAPFIFSYCFNFALCCIKTHFTAAHFNPIDIQYKKVNATFLILDIFTTHYIFCHLLSCFISIYLQNKTATFSVLDSNSKITWEELTWLLLCLACCYGSPVTDI